LQEQDGFDWRSRVTLEKLIKEFLIEGRRVNIRPAGAPPRRRRFSVVKSDAAKEARVAKYQSAFRLVKDKMVVLLGSESRRFDAQFPGHAEMNPEPSAAGEFEEHLLSPRFRPKKASTREEAGQGPRVLAPKDAFPRVKLNAQNLLPKAGVPLSAIIFDFSELGHGVENAVAASLRRGEIVPRRSRNAGPRLQRSCVMC
jgi:hypothetical protein